MGDKIIIYGKAGWPYTREARSAYGEGAIYMDVLEDKNKLKEMLKVSNGVREVPVIVEGERVKIGYGGSWGVWPLIGDGFTPPSRCPSCKKAHLEMPTYRIC